jgi:hypothetical protein
VKASIVIRTFNSERTIRQVLEGVMDQSFDDYEVVIVDSGSTDRTLEIVREYPHRFVDYSDRKFTYGGSLNTGIRASQGEYIVCLSHHCIPLHSEWLENLVSAMEEESKLAGAWGPLIFELSDYAVGRSNVEVIDLEEFYRRPNQGLQNPNSIIRRELWEEHPFSEAVPRCEDQYWAHHFLQQGYRTAMVYASQVLYVPQFTLREYVMSNYRNLMTLNEMFGYRPTLSGRALLWHSVRAIGGAALGRRSPRVSGMILAGILARWAASRKLSYKEAMKQVGGTEDATRLDTVRALARVSRKKLRQARERWQPRAERALSVLKDPPVASTKRKTCFFLVGEMRSGTSWLQRTLNTHPEIFCKGEGSFFGRDQYAEEIPVYTGPAPSLYNALAENDRLRTWQNLMWNGWSKGDREEDLRNLVRFAIDYYLEKDSAASGKRIVGDKSPLHTDYVDEIFDLYPDARVIHIMRDGRDVAVSLMHHFWRMAKDRGGIFELEPVELEKRDAYLADPQGFLASGESIFTEERLRQMAVRWSRRVSKASRDGAAHPGNFYQLRYEDLLEEPEEHLKRIFGLLGARSEEALVSHCVEQNRFEKLAKRSKGREDPDSFYRKGIAGDWSSTFTQRDREIYNEVAGKVLLEMGYSIG